MSPFEKKGYNKKVDPCTLNKKKKKKKKRERKFPCSINENSEYATSIEPDEVAHYEMAHHDFHFCLEVFEFSIRNIFNDTYFGNFVDANLTSLFLALVVCN